MHRTQEWAAVPGDRLRLAKGRVGNTKTTITGTRMKPDGSAYVDLCLLRGYRVCDGHDAWTSVASDRWSIRESM